MQNINWFHNLGRIQKFSPMGSSHSHDINFMIASKYTP